MLGVFTSGFSGCSRLCVLVAAASAFLQSSTRGLLHSQRSCQLYLLSAQHSWDGRCTALPCLLASSLLSIAHDGPTYVTAGTVGLGNGIDRGSGSKHGIRVSRGRHLLVGDGWARSLCAPHVQLTPHLCWLEFISSLGATYAHPRAPHALGQGASRRPTARLSNGHLCGVTPKNAKECREQAN
jgi:hypothetical protein